MPARHRLAERQRRAWWRETPPQFEPVGHAATEARHGEFWGEKAFRFGLERLLDGIAALIASR